jgi:HD-GYP domain-containing protein (c-di-GMP phosphodiesterase class II)
MRLPIKTINGGGQLESRVFRKLAQSTDEFEGYQHPHAERIAAVVSEIGKAFNLGAKDLQSLRAAALLHDLGEVRMDRDYLKRAGSLTDEEILDLQRHPLLGEQEAAKSGADRATQLIVRWHHEWWNGCGYPDALRREEIPLAARILRVVDSYMAVTDTRPFRPPMSTEAARAHLKQWAGLEFDPVIVTTLLSLGSMPELQSFSPSAAELELQDHTRQKEVWPLFSSFNR